MDLSHLHILGFLFFRVGVHVYELHHLRLAVDLQCHRPSRAVRSSACILGLQVLDDLGLQVVKGVRDLVQIVCALHSFSLFLFENLDFRVPVCLFLRFQFLLGVEHLLTSRFWQGFRNSRRHHRLGLDRKQVGHRLIVPS